MKHGVFSMLVSPQNRDRTTHKLANTRPSGSLCELVYTAARPQSRLFSISHDAVLASPGFASGEGRRVRENNWRDSTAEDQGAA